MSTKKKQRSDEQKDPYDRENLPREPSPVEEALPDEGSEVSEAETGNLRGKTPEERFDDSQDYYQTKDVEEMVESDAISPFEAGHIDGYTSGERTAYCMLCRTPLLQDPFETAIEGRRYNFCSEEHMQTWLSRKTAEGDMFPTIAGDEEAEPFPRRGQP